MVLRKSFYIRWSAGRSPQVHEVNPGRDPSGAVVEQTEARRRGEEQRWNRGYCGGRRWTVA